MLARTWFGPGARATVENSCLLGDASAQDIEHLCARLQAFNRPWLGAGEEVQISLAARSPTGDLLGGILGTVALGWLEIHVLWVDPDMREAGVGTALLEECERVAIGMQVHSARLDTFEWQAERFYAQRGYVCFARLADYPVGYQRIFMKKHFAAS
jgi:GNAT superfamily N-acetyltransferase